MTPEELATPLTETEKARLVEACQGVLSRAGMDLLRRALFETDRAQEKAYILPAVR
jgi:hypothetical protein